MRRFALFAIAIVFVASIHTNSVGAAISLDYMSSNVEFYDPNWTNDTCDASGSGTSSTIVQTTLPSETVSYLDGRNVKKLAEQNMARYQAAQTATGIPWQAVAALHYREAGMNPNSSIYNGAALGSGTNVDGQVVVSDANQDAINATNHFKKMASSVYKINMTNPGSLTLEDWGNAFLAYNRGALYKNNGKTYDQSPYVMNGFDSNHMDMNWVGGAADPGSSTRNGGKDGNKAGALAVMAYLGITKLGAGCSGTGAGNGDIVKTALGLAHTSPVNTGTRFKKDATPAYQSAQPKYNGSKSAGTCLEDQWSDCGVFVSTVMHMSGVDLDFPVRSTKTMIGYIKNSSKYTVIENPTVEQLQPGDILVYNNSIRGHIMIFTGKNGNYTSAEASLCERVPSVRTAGSVTFQLGQSGVIAGRLK